MRVQFALATPQRSELKWYRARHGSIYGSKRAVQGRDQVRKGKDQGLGADQNCRFGRTPNLVHEISLQRKFIFDGFKYIMGFPFAPVISFIKKEKILCFSFQRREIGCTGIWGSHTFEPL